MNMTLGMLLLEPGPLGLAVLLHRRSNNHLLLR